MTKMSPLEAQVCPDLSFLKQCYPSCLPSGNGEVSEPRWVQAQPGAAVPDVVVEVVPLLSLRHRESHFPRHGSDPAAGRVGLPGLGEGHIWQHRDKDKESEFSKARGAG